MGEEMLRLYGPDELRVDGYPIAWREINAHVVAEAGSRCQRCGHPYVKGTHGARGEWSPCDELCTHFGPGRFRPGPLEAQAHGRALAAGMPPLIHDDGWVYYDSGGSAWSEEWGPEIVEARWRILTVHHLNMAKEDCRWWNLVALCQRCHLSIQSRVRLEQTYPFEHSPWFKPYAAGWYAFAYLDKDVSREQAEDHLEEFLALERRV